MIFDRTQNDVDTAIRLRNEKVKFDPITMQPINPEELTESEISILEKGTITYNTLNRIENKQDELKNLFNEMGYRNTPTTNKVWGENDIFNVDDFQRIIDNTNVLRNAFFVYKDTPNTPPVSYHWQDINALEKILVDIEKIFDDMLSSFIYLGDEYYLGGI